MLHSYTSFLFLLKNNQTPETMVIAIVIVIVPKSIKPEVIVKGKATINVDKEAIVDHIGMSLEPNLFFCADIPPKKTTPQINIKNIWVKGKLG